MSTNAKQNKNKRKLDSIPGFSGYYQYDLEL
jgi:hypothetical protein